MDGWAGVGRDVAEAVDSRTGGVDTKRGVVGGNVAGLREEDGGQERRVGPGTGGGDVQICVKRVAVVERHGSWARDILGTRGRRHHARHTCVLDNGDADFGEIILGGLGEGRTEKGQDVGAGGDDGDADFGAWEPAAEAACAAIKVLAEFTGGFDAGGAAAGDDNRFGGAEGGAERGPAAAERAFV